MLVLKKMFRNKRGDDMLIDFWAIAVFAIILLLFFLLFSVNKSVNADKVQTQFINTDVNFMLESFLRAPAIGITPPKTIGEVIMEDSTTGDFKRTDDLFRTYFKRMDQMNNEKINRLYLTIRGQNTKEKNIEFITENGKKAGSKFMLKKQTNEYKYKAETYVPGYTEKIYVQLILSEFIPDDRSSNNGGTTKNQ